MSDLNRKQFEEYYNDWGGFGCQYCLHHRMGDSYNIPDIAKAWRHWQASRECLVIELPERGPSFAVGGVISFSLKNEGRNEAIKEIEIKINAVGVKTK